LDTGSGFRLEKWGEVILQRPDPQIIWERTLTESEWNKAWAVFTTGKDEEKGSWKIKKNIPHNWSVKFKDTVFKLKLSSFKHTGLFAEQAANWDWMLNILGGETQKTFSPSNVANTPTSPSKVLHARNESVHATKNLKVLNLFGYTGGATVVLAKAGALVTHVDASKPTLTWANENHKLNNLPKDSVRWILDDAAKFVKRELKRGAQYDGIIMDPPAFGHSPTGKTWRFNQDLPDLLSDCVSLLSQNAKFLVVNAYATNSSALALNNLLQDSLKDRTGKIEFGELCLKHPHKKTGRLISTGIFTRWSLN
jgi:23S rRNA (cytosine1962-C5)-methyltransferase